MSETPGAQPDHRDEVPARGLPLRALLFLVVPFLALLLGFNLVPRDALSRLKAIGLPTPAVFSVAFPEPLLDVNTGKTIPRRRDEVRAFFIGASETYALPYDPPGYASYAFQLGAGYRAVTGRRDIHVRAEGNPALDSPQIVAQARKVLETGDPSLIVLVLGANEFLNRIVRGKYLLPQDSLDRVASWFGDSRQVFDWIEGRMRESERFRPWVRSESDKGTDSVIGFMRTARPGQPAMRGLPIGSRDRGLLVERLRTAIRGLHASCRTRGCRLAIALSVHGMDGSPPWCSELEPGPPELDRFLARVMAQPSEDQLEELESWLGRYPERADLVHARAKIWRAQGRKEAGAEFRRALDLDLAPLHQTREVRAALRAEAAHLQIPFLDLNDAFADALGVTGPERFLDYAHLDLEGHWQLARYLARTLQGNLLPPLPEAFEAKFEGGMREWSAAIQAESIRLARARMSFNLGRYYMAFGNFRDALPHCERAARLLADEGPGAREDLEFCRRMLAESGRR